MLIFFIGTYLAVVLLIGWFSSKYIKSSQDYVLASRQMPTFVVASGLFATWFGSETVMGASSEFLKHGFIGVMEDPFGAALCLLLIGLFFARPLYKLKLYTFSDYFSQRFDKKVELVSALFMIPSYFSWIAAQLIALAVILNIVLGISFTAGVLICACVVLFYTYIGGMWSISITDTIQTALIIIGLLYLCYFYYDLPLIKSIYADLQPKGFFKLTPHKNDFMSWVTYFSAIITLGWGSIPQQDVFQRVLSAKSERAAVRGSIYSSIMYLTIAFMPLFIVLVGSRMHPELLKGDPQMFLLNLVLHHSNILVQILFFGALISAILSTCSAAVLAPATVIAENIIKPYFDDKISDQALLKIMRYSTVVITLIAVMMSFIKTNIYELVGEASAFSLVALFVPLVGGLYWKKSTSLGAILSMTMGTTAWLIGMNIDMNFPPAVFGLLCSLAGMLLGSFISKSK